MALTEPAPLYQLLQASALYDGSLHQQREGGAGAGFAGDCKELSREDIVTPAQKQLVNTMR